MSYPPPPQPGQDPNNPYAQPQQGQQPGYGYPQQGQQPGYGYPQQGGLPSYGGPAEQGYPMGGGYGAPMVMPGGVKAARVILFIVGGLGILGAIGMFIFAATFDDLVNSSSTTADADVSMMADLGAGVIAVIGVLMLVFAGLGIMLAAKFSNGGSGVRIGTIVYGAFMILFGVLNLPVGILQLVLGILVVVFVAKSDGNAWFNRPRY